MIALPTGTRVWIAAGITDMRRGFDGLASIVQEKLLTDPFASHVFVFRGRRGDLIKVLCSIRRFRCRRESCRRHLQPGRHGKT